MTAENDDLSRKMPATFHHYATGESVTETITARLRQYYPVDINCPV